YLVNGLYLQYLNRPAEADGQTHWVTLLEVGGTEEQVTAGIVSSTEFYDRASRFEVYEGGGVGYSGSGGASTDPDRNYVSALYAGFLSHRPDNTEINFWLQQLPTLGREGVAEAMLGSSEGRSVIVA